MLLFAPTPALSQVLVDNILGISSIRSFTRDVAQGFGTGGHSDGYTVTSVEIHMSVSPGNTTPVYTAGIWSASSGRPNTRLGTLTVPDSIVAGVNTFTTVGIDLAAHTTYFVVVDVTTEGSAQAWRTHPSKAENNRKAPGWTISDFLHLRAANNSTGWSISVNPGQMRISGVARNATNIPPVSGNPKLTTLEDTEYTYALRHFPLYDADAGDTLGYVRIVTLPASDKGTLTLNGANVSAGDSVSPADLAAGHLKYIPPANAHGSNYASFTFKVSDGTDESATYTVTMSITPMNDPATGAPTISGTAQMGQTLTAATTGIVDVDGLTSPTYGYQWIRVDADGTSNPTDIAGAASGTYTQVRADVGKKLRVKVSFTDDDGNDEELTSAPTATETVLDPTVGICGRTLQVRGALVALIPGVSHCADVTAPDLAAITGTLSVSGENITALAAGDFEGLTALTSLDLSRNGLTALPADVFNGLTALTSLVLSYNDLATLDDDVFDGLTLLEQLYLGENDLATLPADVFDGLTSLEGLHLSYNDLATLLADVFDGLTALTDLSLSANDLTTLPDDVFEPLTALTDLALRGNPGAPFAPEVVILPDDGTVSNGGGTVTLDGSGSGGPWGTNVTYGWALTDPASGVTVTFDDAASATPVVTIPALATDTELTFILTVTGRGGTDGIAPATDTATVTAILDGGICGRTLQVRNDLVGLVGQSPGVSHCAQVTASHLAAITGTLTLNSVGLTALAAGDFDGLTSLRRLFLADNDLATLGEGVFDGLTSLMELSLIYNDLATLDDDVFQPLTALTTLALRENPGAPFAPEAVALPDDGTVPFTGGTVTLDGSGSDGGPWGTNVTYGWTLTEPASGVTVTFDDEYEVQVRATNAEGTGDWSDPPGSGATDANAAPSFAIAPASASEGDAVTFTATLAAAATQAVTVDYATSVAAGDTAAQTDFMAGSGTLTFAAGETQQTFTVGTVEDSIDESDETFTVTLAGVSPAGAATLPADPTATGTIIDDDNTPVLSISVAPGAIAEAGGTSAVTVSTGTGSTFRDDQTITLVVSGTATETADYNISSKSLTLPAGVGSGASSVTATVTAVDDNFYDGRDDDETIVIAGSREGTAFGAQHTIFIADDEDAPEFTLILTPASISESGGTSIVTGTLDTPIAEALTGTLGTFLDPNADPPVVAGDYVISGSLTFAAHSTQSTGTLTVTAVDNRVHTDDKLLDLEWIPDLGYVKSGEAYLIIEDDDAAPVLELSVNPETIAEAGGTSTVTVSTGAGSTFRDDQTITLVVSGTATETADYNISSKSLTLPAGVGSGASSVTATVTAVDDALFEGGETVLIDAALGTGGMAPAVGTSLTLTIIDDDRHATGAPAITGTAQVGMVLTASPGSIADADGLTGVRYGYQWIRVDGVDEADIGAANAATYTPVPADVGKTLKVRASFTDDAGFDEQRTSDAYPASGTVEAVPNAAPSFTSPATFDAAENQTVVGTVAAADSDAGDGVTGYALQGGADASRFTIVEATGVLAFTSAPNFEAAADADTNNEYVVVVRATSGMGARLKTADQTITVTVTDEAGEAPGAPATPSVSTASVTSVTVAWAAPSNAGPPITDYDYRYRVKTPRGPWTEVTNTPITALSTTIAGLAENTEYEVQVRATNAEGTGDWSDPPGSGATDANAAPSFTSAATFDAAENQTVAGTVAASDGDPGDGVTGYAIESGADAARFTIVEATGELAFTSAPNFEAPADADGDNEYVVVVRATSGTGAREKTADQTITVTVTDEAGEAPGAPATPSVSTASVSSVTVAWAAPSNAGPAITDYDYRYRVKTPRGPWTEVTNTPITALSTTIAGLAENTEYEVQVRATNAEGTGGWSDPPGSGATDANAAPSFTIAPASASEGDAVTFTATLAAAATQAVTVDYATSVAASDTAAPTDFMAGSGTLTFAAGETQQTFTVGTVEDSIDESDETFTVTLAGVSPAGAATLPADPTATGTIIDDDAAPVLELSVNPETIAEAGGTSAVTVSTGAGSTFRDDRTITLVVSGTATETADYNISSKSLTLPAGVGSGASSVTATVTAVDDNFYDGRDDDETIVIAGSREGTAFGAQHTIFIADDEDAPEFTLILTPASISESGGTSIVTGTLDTPIAEALTGTLGTFLDPNADPPVVAGDYVISGSLTFAAHSTQSTGTLTVTAVDNRVHTDDKLLDLEWIPDLGYVKSGEAYLIIEDDDAAPSFTSAATFDAAENQTVVGTVAASDGDPGDGVTGYAIESGADAARFTIVEATGELAFTSAPNFEAPADADGDNDYVVVVRATSGTGAREKTADQTITVTVTDEAGEAPGAPATPTVSSASVSSVTVTWAAPSNAGPPITDYDYRYRVKTPRGPWTEVTNTPITGTSTTIAGLAENTEYEVQVRATNAEGTGDWSDPPGSGATDANAAPSFTSAATFDAAENQTVVGTVAASDGDPGDGVTGYAIESGADAARFTIVEATGELAFTSAPNFEAPADADGDNDYVVVVRATSGTGAREKTADQTITVTVTDEAGEAPGAPATPTVSSASVSSVTVTWAAPSNAGPPITDYDYRYRVKTPRGPWTEVTNTPITGTSTTIAGLAENTEYEVQVRATNAEGTGDWSDPPGSGATDANAAPSFTSAATFDAAENQTVVGTVAASDGDPGDGVTGYAIESGADAARFTIVEATGELAFTSAPNFEAPADADGDNDYVVVVRATSGTGAREKTADQTITVTVTDEAGEAPGAPATPTVSTASVTQRDGGLGRALERRAGDHGLRLPVPREDAAGALDGGDEHADHGDEHDDHGAGGEHGVRGAGAGDQRRGHGRLVRPPGQRQHRQHRQQRPGILRRHADAQHGGEYGGEHEYRRGHPGGDGRGRRQPDLQHGRHGRGLLRVRRIDSADQDRRAARLRVERQLLGDGEGGRWQRRRGHHCGDDQCHGRG